MTAEARGRIVLYIDDKEVTNSVKNIKAEIKKLQYEQEKLTIGTEEYVQKGKKIKELNTILQDHRNQLKSSQGMWGSLADKLNKYQTMLVGVIAALGGFVISMKNMVTGAADLEDALADVRKTTGLTMSQVRGLADEFRKMDTRSSRKELLELAEIAGKLGIEGYQNVLSFVKGADKIKVALAKDLGGNVEEAVNTIGKLVDIFKVKDEYGIEEAMNKVGSVINALGAASAASETNIVEFIKRLGGVAPNAKMSIEDVAGLGATLDSLGQSSEVAGTAVSQLVIGMFKKTDEFAKLANMSVKDFAQLLNKDANAALIKLLQGLKGNNGSMMEMAQHLNDLKLDGARAVSVVGVLANNIDMLQDQQTLANDEFKKGTSLMNEYAIKNETLGANLQKMGKTLYGWFINGGIVDGINSIVKGFLKITEIPVSKTLEDQHKKVNALTTALMDHTLQADMRNKLYQELVDIAPEVAAGMTAEKINYGLLTKNLASYNDQMLMKIVLQKQDEKILEKNEKTAKAWTELYKDQVRLSEQINEKIAVYAKNNPELTNQVKLLQNQFNAGKLAIEDFATELFNLDKNQKKGSFGRFDLQVLGQYQLSMHKYKEALQEANIELVNRIKMQTELIKQGLTLNTVQKQLNKTEDEGNKDVGGGGDAGGGGGKDKGAKIIPLTSGLLETVNSNFKKAYDSAKKFQEDAIQVANDWIKEDYIILTYGFEAYVKYLRERKNEDEDYFTFIARKTEESTDQMIQYWKDYYEEDWIIEQVGLEAYSEYLKNRRDADETYYEWVKRKHKETEEYKRKQLEVTVQFSRIITDGIANYYAASKERELIAAGDNEEKKKEINKKYADKEFAISVARIVVSTAEAIMQAYAQLGPIAGTIAAVLMAGVGVAEIGVVNAQRQSIKGMKTGGLVEGQGTEDTELRLLAPNEYVNREPVVSKLGRRFFDILNSDPVNPDVEGAVASLGMRGGSQSVSSAQSMAQDGVQALYYEIAIALDKLNKNLDDGIKAVAYYDNEETLRLRKTIKKMDDIDVSAKR